MYSWSAEDNRAYLAACDSLYGNLTCVHGPEGFSSDGVTAICVARNEAERLPSFLAHYARLGVRHIHILDNASSDETRAIAVSWPNTTVWSAEGSYAEASYGQKWIGAVVRRHGLGKWVLNVDVDEHLVYDGMQHRGIDALCAWLESRKQRRLFAPLIDMYSRLPLAGQPGAGLARVWRTMRDKLRADRALGKKAYFDHCDFYFDRWGPQNPGKYHFTKGPWGMQFAGGVRERMIAKEQFCLSKVPLVVWDKETSYWNVHFPYPFDVNPDAPYGALLHFKFVGDFERRVAAAIREKQHWDDAYEYKLYAQWLSEQPSLYDPKYSLRYKDPTSLISEGLLFAIDWDKSNGDGEESLAARQRATPEKSHLD